MYHIYNLCIISKKQENMPFSPKKKENHFMKNAFFSTMHCLISAFHSKTRRIKILLKIKSLTYWGTATKRSGSMTSLALKRISRSFTRVQFDNNQQYFLSGVASGPLETAVLIPLPVCSPFLFLALPPDSAWTKTTGTQNGDIQGLQTHQILF